MSAPLVAVSQSDVDRALAVAAYQGSSFTPEKRAAQVQREYVEAVRSLEKRLSPVATTPEAREVLAADLELYRDGYLKRLHALLSAQSRTVSPMVTGASNFPAARNRKRMETVRRRLDELVEWQKKAERAVARRVKAAARGPEDPARDLAEAEAFHEKMVQANAILRRNGLSDSEQREKLLALGLKESTATEIMEGDFAGRRGFPGYVLRKNRNRIKRLQEKVKAAEATEDGGTETVAFDGGEIVENLEVDRLQVVFDEKPPAELRSALKARGFRWAPSQGAWQRKLTPAARMAAEDILRPTEAQ